MHNLNSQLLTHTANALSSVFSAASAKKTTASTVSFKKLESIGNTMCCGYSIFIEYVIRIQAISHWNVISHTYTRAIELVALLCEPSGMGLGRHSTLHALVRGGNLLR